MSGWKRRDRREGGRARNARHGFHGISLVTWSVGSSELGNNDHVQGLLLLRAVFFFSRTSHS